MKRYTARQKIILLSYLIRLPLWLIAISVCMILFGVWETQTQLATKFWQLFKKSAKLKI